MLTMSTGDCILISSLIALLVGTTLYYGLKESFLFYKTTTPQRSNPEEDMRKKRTKPYESKKNFKSLRLGKLMGLIVLTLFLLTLIPVDLELDYILNLRSPDNARTILKTILGVEGSLLILFFAVLLMMFNSSKETLGRNAVSRISFTEGHLFTYLFGIIMSLIVTFISFVLVQNEIRNLNIAQTYLSSVFLLVLLVLLIPVIYKTIKGTASLKLIDELFDQLDSDRIDELFEQRRMSHDATTIEVLQSHPIYLLSSLTKKHIDLEDQLPVQLIFKLSISKTIDLLAENPTQDNCKRTMEAFNTIWNPILHKASGKNDIFLLEHFNVLFREVNRYWARNELALRNLDPLFDIMTEAYEKFGKERFTKLLSDGIMQVGFAFNDHLELNCPKAKEIPDLGWTLGEIYDLGEIASGNDSNYQWNAIQEKYEDYFRQLFTISIESSNSKLLYSMFMSAGSTIGSIDRMEIEEPKKHILIVGMFFNAAYSYLEAIDKGVIRDSDDCSFIRHSPVTAMIENNRKYFKIILRSYGQLMIDIAKRGKLGAHYSWLFGITRIGRFCAMKFDEDDRYKDSLFFIIDVLDKVKQELEPLTNENLDQYYSLYTDLESFRSTYKDSHDGRSSRSLSLKINRVKRSFKNMDLIKKSLNNRFVNFN